MELWIRSQDRSILTKINDLEIDINGFNENFVIKANLDSRISEYYKLGTYKSKERTLEVLDDIQDVMLNEVKCENHLTDINYKCCNGIILYQMPKE